jgi:hypothetical protein
LPTNILVRATEPDAPQELTFQNWESVFSPGKTPSVLRGPVFSQSMHSNAQRQNPSYRRSTRIIPTKHYRLDKIGSDSQARPPLCIPAVSGHHSNSGKSRNPPPAPTREFVFSAPPRESALPPFTHLRACAPPIFSWVRAQKCTKTTSLLAPVLPYNPTKTRPLRQIWLRIATQPAFVHPHRLRPQPKSGKIARPVTRTCLAKHPPLLSPIRVDTRLSGAPGQAWLI